MNLANRKIVHIEIPAHDVASSRNFYASLFGWEFETFDGGGIDYSSTSSSSVDIGLPPVDGEMNHAGEVVIYIESPNIDEDLRAIEAAGGTVIIPRREVGGVGMGAIAIFKDPAGNTLGLWEDLKQ